MGIPGRAALGLAKVGCIGAVFLGCFAATFPVVLLMDWLFPDAPFLVHVFPVLPLMFLANRFVLSPLEYHLKMPSMQYDPWYERKQQRRSA